MIKKEDVVAACAKVLNDKLRLFESQLADIRDSMENETKSSLGDKHETSRARMQSEEEKLEKQVSDIKTQIRDLNRLPTGDHEFIQRGSLVNSNHGYFFIGPALGKISVNGQDVFVISDLSPLGKLLPGLQVHAEFSVNGRDYKINSVH